MIIIFVKFVVSIKHIILISSLQLFLFILCGLYFEDDLFCFCFILFYLISMIYILWDSQGHTAIFIPFFLTDLSNLKQLIVISALLLIFYYFIIFSFFPIIMFLSKYYFVYYLMINSFG